MRPKTQIEHDGVVVAVERGMVRVAVEVGEACGSCASRKSCAMGASEQREIDVVTAEAEHYAIGERVVVSAHRTTGIMAVVFCYLLPLVVLCVTIVGATMAGMNEGLAAAAALMATALYYLLLAWQHKNIARKVTFTIDKR